MNDFHAIQDQNRGKEKISPEDCAIQSQMPFLRDDDSSRRSAQYKANCPSQGWRILKLQVEQEIVLRRE